jgi:hypothetical protein
LSSYTKNKKIEKDLEKLLGLLTKAKYF